VLLKFGKRDKDTNSIASCFSWRCY